MAEFCLDCLREFEPNANERNTILSKDNYICEGCGKPKQIVITFSETNKREKN